MERLSYQILEKQSEPPFFLKKAPEKILQFGEGNFLRGFVDYFFDILNETGLFHGKCVVIQPLNQGASDCINQQEGLYTLYLRAEKDGHPSSEKRIISVISRAINPYYDPEAFLACAKNPELRIIVSNTTEAGIVFHDTDALGSMNGTFPAKLTLFLWKRYQHFGHTPGKGFLILSCELIDDNGSVLKSYVMRYAKLWGLPEEFSQWVDVENVFCNTLVDRIITGYPHRDAGAMNQENGYEDQLIDTGEPFAFWAIEGPDWMKEELPFDKADLPIRIVPDQSNYKKRKVRILNGAQTATTLPAYLAGIELEREYMNDALFYHYISQIMFQEILPATDLDMHDMGNFAKTCLERLRNPYIDHRLIDISLNSISKWNARILPTLEDFYLKYKTLPQYLTFSLAALLAFYRCEKHTNGHFYGNRNGIPYEVRDDLDTLQFFAAHSRASVQDYVHAYITNPRISKVSPSVVPELEKQVMIYLDAIDRGGIRSAMEQLQNISPFQ